MEETNRTNTQKGEEKIKKKDYPARFRNPISTQLFSWAKYDQLSDPLPRKGTETSAGVSAVAASATRLSDPLPRKGTETWL